MIFKTPYETTACSGSLMKKTIEALQEARIHNYVPCIPGTQIMEVQGGSAALDMLPAFAHPLAFLDHDKQPMLAIDVRQFGRFDPHRGEFVVRNQIEYQLAKHRAVLTQLWLTDRPQLLRDISPTAIAVFTAWISEAIGRRFALDPREQFELAILVALFYAGLFAETNQFDDRDQLRVVNAVARATRAKAEDVLAVLDQLETIPSNIVSLCEAAPRVTKSVRLQELNAGVLCAIVAGTWFGTNAKEMAAVALEHPPTWLAILLAAFVERTYRRSGITATAERIAGRSGSDDFARAVLHLISSATASAHS